MNTCPHCNTEYLDQAKFCPSCGKTLAAEDILCQECGTRNPMDSKFCFACGESFGQVPENNETLENPAVSEEYEAIDSEEDKKQRIQKARALAQTLKEKKGSPKKKTVSSAAEHKESDYPSLASTDKIQDTLQETVTEERLQGMNDRVLATLERNLDDLQKTHRDFRYLQLLKDKLTVRTLLSNSPFQMPERRYE